MRATGKSCRPHLALIPGRPILSILVPGGSEICNRTTRDGFIGSIGNTPLIKLRRASEETGCTVLGKAEFLNPGGSIKDRAALAIVKDAEARGNLRPGGVIVEGTAGNTGIGLALVGLARGYRTAGRDARDWSCSEDGHVAPARRRSAARCRSVPLFRNSDALRALFGPACRGDRRA